MLSYFASTTKTISANSLWFLGIFIILSSQLFGVGHAQTETSEFPLTKRSDYSCAEIIANSTFTGNCCRLSDAVDGPGCELLVRNGRCQIEGPIWTLNFRSNYKLEPCPDYADEYIITTAPSSSPTMMPSASPTIFNETAASAATTATTTNNMLFPFASTCAILLFSMGFLMLN